MDYQQPSSDRQRPCIQPEKYQQIRHQKHKCIPWQWYRSRRCKLKEELVYRAFVSVFLFSFCITIASGCGNQVSTRSVSPAGFSATPNHAPTSIPNAGLTPPAQVFTPVLPATEKPLPTSATVPYTSPTVYYGVHVASVKMSLIASFETDAHKPVAIVMWYQQWGINNGYQYFQPAWMNAVRAHGSIPLITWEPWNSILGTNQPAYALRNIINGNFDSYITQWAKASKAWGHPYFLRFAHEMNGNWYPWSEQVNGNKPGQFVLAWRHVHDIFTGLGVTNVTWVWSPNKDYSNSTPLRELYPGVSYVDWVAMDGYNSGNIDAWHTWKSFSAIFQQTYNEMLAITSKPMMIGEMASTEQGGNKAAWISDAYTSQIPHYFSHIRAVIWFNQYEEIDWRIESSAAAQNAFSTAIQSDIYASNSYVSLNVSPISAP